MNFKPLPSAERLHELFAYDSVSGCLIRIKGGSNRAKIGAAAGSVRPDGRLIAYVDGSMHLVHRLVFVFCTGRQPVEQIDHIDRNPQNNRIENLRECTQSENCANTSMRRGNRTGFKGVSRATDSDRWCANIKAFGTKHHLGSFRTPAEAAAAYDSAALRLFGKFASPNFPR